jgi:hypothetical protein
MAYLAGSIAIGVKGLFHSDWLGDGSQRLILAHSVGKSGTPYTMGESCQWIWQVFLILRKQNCHVELSCNTPSSLSPSWAIAPLFSRPSVRDGHGGGGSRKINAWHIYTLMVYL